MASLLSVIYLFVPDKTISNSTAALHTVLFDRHAIAMLCSYVYLKKVKRIWPPNQARLKEFDRHTKRTLRTFPASASVHASFFLKFGYINEYIATSDNSPFFTALTKLQIF